MENAASIVSKFGQALVEELQEIRGVGDKVIHLRDELASMNAVLRMLAESDEDCVDHLIREWTKQVRELASDAEDCVDIYKLRVRRPLPRPVDPEVPDTRMNTAKRILGQAKLLPDMVRLQFVKLFLMHGLAVDLKALLARMVIISERRVRYNVDQQALRRSACFVAVSPVTLSASALRPADNPEQFIGLTEQVNTLAKGLRPRDDDQDKSVKVFSIVGFGGLGKTTLAMEVCRALEVDFPHQAQVSVSQAFDAGKDLEGLLKRILHQMMIKQRPDSKQGTKEEDADDAVDGMDMLTNTLQRLLSDKRYLIVIDDVWATPAWEAIRSKLPIDNMHNSRIIVTTRVASVAKACSPVGWVDSMPKSSNPVSQVESVANTCSSVGGVDSVAKTCNSVGGVDSVAKTRNSVGGVDSVAKTCNPDSQVESVAKTCNPVNQMESVEKACNPISQVISAGKSCSKVSPVESVSKGRGSAGQVDSVTTTCNPITSALGVNCFVHHMEPLEQEVSKQLFMNRVFGAKEKCPKELEGSMHNILRKCGGLPLAIVSMASLLASYKSPGSKDMWRKICNSIGSQLESNPTLEGMRQIITLSYSHLPHHLKNCMMYLSIFPEDYEIKKKWLLRRWMAEGLVVEKRGLKLLDVAESYFDELMSRSMIVPAGISYDGTLKTCRVHDMMLEVIVSKALEANFVSLVGGQECEGESHGKIRRLSIQSGGGPKDERSVKHVRSLSTFHPQGHKALLERLGEFTLLRVLDLEDCKALENKHMKHVCQMFLLRFLNLDGTNISKMPKKIRKLVHLQTLSLKTTRMVRLPSSMVELEKLEFLYSQNWRLPCELGRMKALRVLDVVSLYDDGAKAAREIGELTQLRKLDIDVNCSQGVFQVLVAALNRTYSLRQLSIYDFSNEKIMNNLGKMTSPPLLLRSMKIRGGIDGMPEWFGSLMHLVKLEISRTMLSSDEILGILCELPNLLRLTLGYKSYTNDALVISAKYRFPVLKQLSVDSSAYEGHEEIIFEQGPMAMLEKLELDFGCKEKSLSGIEHLPSLKEVVLQGARFNDTLNQAVLQLKSESDRRPAPNQFKVVARYYGEEW